MPFDEYLSKQAKRKDNYTTPMQAINRAGEVHQEIFGVGRQNRIVTDADWKRLDEAENKSRVARNFLRDGTYDKTGN